MTSLAPNTIPTTSTTAAATAAATDATAASTNFNVTDVLRPMQANILVHRAEGLVKVSPIWKMKPAVILSITRNGTPIHSVRTRVDSKGGSEPHWDCQSEFFFNTTASTQNSYSLVLKVKHHGWFLGKRTIGKAVVPIRDLMADYGVGTEKSYPLIKSGQMVGNIFVTHKIKQLDGVILPDLAQEVGEGSGFKWPDLVGPIIGCFSGGTNIGNLVSG